MSLRIRMSQLAMLGLSALAGAAHALELEWGRFIGRMKASRDGAGRLLDRTMSVFGAGMGNASSHDSTDLPVLPAGDRFRHGQHLAHDPKNPPPAVHPVGADAARARRGGAEVRVEHLGDPLGIQRMTLPKGALMIAIASLAAGPAVADEKPGPTAWTETFDSEDTLDSHWTYTGYLPTGGTVSDRKHRSQYWQVVDGRLQGNDLADVHGASINRKATGGDVRVSFRFKLPPNGFVSCGLRGEHPLVDRNFSVMGLHIRPTGVYATDNTTLHPKDSPEAAALKAKGGWNRRFIHDAKVAKMKIDPDAWHEAVIEARGREQRVLLDGREVFTYTSLVGDTPKTSVNLGIHSEEKRVVHGYFDDVRFEPLEAAR